MVGIGRGLMMNGSVMLIDEPSLGLAPIIIEQIYEVIARLKASGRTILLVEENPARVADIADRIHLLDNGAFVWSGEPAVLLQRDELLATYLGADDVEIIGPVLVSGITTGALYALATLGLSLVWGSLGMLNMAHGTLLTLGGYAAFTAASQLGLPVPLAVLAATAVGGVIGALIFALVAYPLSRRSPETFETTIMIATFGVALTLENAVLRLYGGQPLGQPLSVGGAINLGGFALPWQNLIIVVSAIALMGATALF